MSNVDLSAFSILREQIDQMTKHIFRVGCPVIDLKFTVTPRSSADPVYLNCTYKTLDTKEDYMKRQSGRTHRMMLRALHRASVKQGPVYVVFHSHEMWRFVNQRYGQYIREFGADIIPLIVTQNALLDCFHRHGDFIEDIRQRFFRATDRFDKADIFFDNVFEDMLEEQSSRDRKYIYRLDEEIQELSDALNETVEERASLANGVAKMDHLISLIKDDESL